MTGIAFSKTHEGNPSISLLSQSGGSIDSRVATGLSRATAAGRGRPQKRTAKTTKSCDHWAVNQTS